MPLTVHQDVQGDTTLLKMRGLPPCCQEETSINLINSQTLITLLLGFIAYKLWIHSGDWGDPRRG